MSKPKHEDQCGFISLREASEMGYGSYYMLRKRISDGTLRGYRSGKTIRVRREDLEAMWKPIIPDTIPDDNQCLNIAKV